MDAIWKLKRIERELGGDSGGGDMIGNVIQGHVEHEQLWRLQKCLVGEVASFCELKSLADRVNPGKWGTLVSLGENWSGAKNYEKVDMLISISQVQKLDKTVLLEVGDVRFPVSIRERGWLEEQKNKDSFSKKERIMRVADESVSESESVIRLESEKWSAGN
ncbi:hypothetical protein J1N35_028582 [Gossypium stocksii]|uniref:Uncharacterized protein n=1 Tax=Gossypium stocksii TaxID=47602 RepID=A0A9D3ZSQ6_9ROSI|nr:hypothetical protein J1N35_028582 [Gossypium stocksii]